MHVHNFLNASKIVLLYRKFAIKISIVLVLMATCGYIHKIAPLGYI